MFKDTPAFSGFSVDNEASAKQFYRDTLDINIEEQPGMGFRLLFPNGQRVFVYAKPDHTPASFTVLNFPVENIDQAIDELNAKSIECIQYDNPQMPQDEKGVLRGLSHQMGPDIAWFKDPAGNVLSILQDK